MNIEDLRTYCLNKKGVTESFPFGDNTLVFKVLDKVFCLTGIESFQSLNLKCEPEFAIELREQFNAVKPGYHMNKKHWNTITVNQDASDKLILEWVDHSYELVRKKLTKNQKASLDEL